MKNPPRILGVATAVPAYRVEQSEVRRLVENLFREQYAGIERLMPVFENTQIQTRYFSKPLEWFSTQHTFVESTEAYQQTALSLSTEAATTLLRTTAFDKQNIGMVIVVSTTGISTPSLDAKLIQALGLAPNTRRMPLWGLGCAGGVAGLARAAECAQTLSAGKAVLFVAVELCSLTFQRNDVTKSNIVATSLFGDGAAAVLVQMPPESPPQQSLKQLKILNSYSFLFDNSEDIMGWDVLETGLKVRFSRDIPALVRAELPRLLDEACAAWCIQRTEICHCVVHAGGAKVLDAYKNIGLSHEQLSSAYTILQGFGNMSSASVLFALERFMSERQATDELGVMVALGPGFSAEFVLFRW